ncbi:MAG TPA: polysaccharide deacetylase family protein [Polyangiaceae bacterium]|nr:polysaccharide deacetylase family protein [Polyangiaceae bacterium]
MLNAIRQIGDQLSRGWQGQGPVDGIRAVGAASKPLLRDGWADLLARVGATSPSRFARGALTIITFHRVLPADKLRQYPLHGLALTPEQLELVLSELEPHFECSSVIEAYRHWKGNGAPLSRSGSRKASRSAAAGRPPLGISFDDGALDNYEYARPVLEKLSLRATFFVPVAHVAQAQSPWHDRLAFALLRAVAAVRKPGSVDFDRLLAPFGLSVSSFAAILPDDALRLAQQGVAAAKPLSPDRRHEAIEALEKAIGGDQVPDFARVMSWDQVRELARAGHEIGSHSLSHSLLAELPDARVREEVEASRRQLSDALGAPVRSFCYPGGSYDARVTAAVRSAGYECAVTTQWGINRKQSALELARCDMDFARLRSRHGEFSKQRLWLRLSGLQPGLADKVR